MLTKVNIKNFKSIRDLEFAPKRVNVFIGEPNTGKSNIIESLAVCSKSTYGETAIFQDVLRFKTVSDLFFDHDLSKPAKVIVDRLEWSLKFESPYFSGSYHAPGEAGGNFNINVSPTLKLNVSQVPDPRVGFYRFKALSTFSDPGLGALQPPYGSNLVALLITNKRLRRWVSDLFQERGFRLVIDQEKGELSMAKVVDDEFYSFSYPTISETLRRIAFFMAMLQTNDNAVLLLDEPESNTFPFYTKFFAERIALDKTNQFFITTHNPYLLSSIVEKTPMKDLNVFVTTMEKFETKLNRVPDKKLPDLLEMNSDAFFNLEKLVEE
jgi:AAA15 family ATPase/GTPase